MRLDRPPLITIDMITTGIFIVGAFWCARAWRRQARARHAAAKLGSFADWVTFEFIGFCDAQGNLLPRDVDGRLLLTKGGATAPTIEATEPVQSDLVRESLCDSDVE